MVDIDIPEITNPILEISKLIQDRVAPIVALEESARLQSYLDTEVFSRLVSYYADDAVFTTAEGVFSRGEYLAWLEAGREHFQFYIENQRVVSALITLSPVLGEMAKQKDFLTWYVEQKPAMEQIASRVQTIIWYDEKQPDIDSLLENVVPKIENQQVALQQFTDDRVEALKEQLELFHSADIGPLKTLVDFNKNEFVSSLLKQKNRLTNQIDHIRN